MKASHLTLKTPEACFYSLWKRVPQYLRMTYAASVILGIVVHLYMFVNKLPNHDDINHLFSMDYGTASGRWLLPAVLQLDGDFSMPWLIGLLSVLCLAGTVCLTVSLFRIRRPLSCVVTAAVMVSFPTVTATFTYMFTAGPYFFSLLLAALGAYMAVRLRRGTVAGAIAILLSMGIYQSYFCVAAVLMVGALLFETLDGDRSFRELFWKGLRLLGTLAAAMLLYLLVVRITTWKVPLVDYMGISDMGKLSLRELPKLIFKSYCKYGSIFLKNQYNYHFGFLKYAFLAVALCCAALALLLVRERHLGPARTGLALALIVVYPLAGNLIYVMVPGGAIHTLMLYGLSFILVFPIALADHAEQSPNLSRRTAQAAASWVILLTMALTAYSYAITANAAYLKIDLSLRQCTAYSTRLLDKIEACEGYRQGMPVVLLGSKTREAALSPTPQVERIQITGVFDLGRFRTTYTYNGFLRYYLGFTGDVYLDGSEQALAFAEDDRVQAMPLYPEAGSIQVIDDTVVVKLND